MQKKKRATNSLIRFREFPIFYIFLLIFLGNSVWSEKGKFNLPVEKVEILRTDGKKSIVVAEIAIKENERNFGFMKRKKIPNGTGMLFVFERDQILSFWMKNTPHPLSIAYIDSGGTIRDIFDMMPFSETSVVSTRSVRYALEVPQDFFKNEGIKTGDQVKINGKTLKERFFAR